VPGYTRRQLKEDKFAETAQGAAQWATGHRRTVVWALSAFVVAVLAIGGLIAWRSHQIENGNDELAAAIRILDAPLTGQTAPGDTTVTFSSIAERGKAAEKKLKEIEDKYSIFGPGKVAHYLRGSALIEAGDMSGAEQEIKTAADSGDKDLAALAKMALAGLYRNSNRQQDAVKIYKDLADHPTASVSKSTAQLALAEIYESTDPQQATAIYQQLKKEDPNSSAAQYAAQKLGGAK